MAAMTFACPGCGAVLKSPIAVAAGKNIKCPQCGTAFATGEAQEDFSPEVEADAPVPVGYDDPAARNGHGPWDLSARGRRPAKPETKWAAAGIVLALAVAGAAAYFAWDRLANGGRNAGSGDEDPLAYVPADSSLVLYIDFGTLMEQPSFGGHIEQSLVQHGGNNFLADCRRETGLDFKDLFHQVTYGIKATDWTRLAANQTQAMTFIIKSRLPFDQRKVARSAKGAVAQTLHGKTYYQINEGIFRFLFMPSDRVMVLTNIPEGELGPVVGSDGKQPALAPEVVAMARGDRPQHVWAVVPITASIRQSLGGLAATVPADLKSVAGALSDAKAGGIWARVEGDQVHVTTGLACASEEAAKQTAADLQSAWDKGTSGVAAKVQMGLTTAMLPKGVHGFVKELWDSTHFSHRGAVAEASARVSVASVENIAREAQRNAGHAPQAGGPPRPVQRPRPAAGLGEVAQ